MSCAVLCFAGTWKGVPAAIKVMYVSQHERALMKNAMEVYRSTGSQLCRAVFPLLALAAVSLCMQCMWKGHLLWRELCL